MNRSLGKVPKKEAKLGRLALKCLLVNPGALARKPGADRWQGWPGSSWRLAWPPGDRAWVEQHTAARVPRVAAQLTGVPSREAEAHLAVTTGT